MAIFIHHIPKNNFGQQAMNLPLRLEFNRLYFEMFSIADIFCNTQNNSVRLCS